MAEYEIYPDGDGWRWRLGDVGEACESRSEAIRAARRHRGDQFATLIGEDGTELGRQYMNGRGPAIVLLREDGSVHGELAHATDGA